MFNLILALIAVESGGNNFAIGDNNRAYGCLQIHEIVIKDVNRIYKTNYKHSDSFDRNKSIEICFLYLSYYGNSERLGRVATDEDFARMWNGGGPYGHKKKSTIKYWKKVQKYL